MKSTTVGPYTLLCLRARLFPPTDLEQAVDKWVHHFFATRPYLSNHGNSSDINSSTHIRVVLGLIDFLLAKIANEDWEATKLSPCPAIDELWHHLILGTFFLAPQEAHQRSQTLELTKSFAVVFATVISFTTVPKGSLRRIGHHVTFAPTSCCAMDLVLRLSCGLSKISRSLGPHSR